MPRRCRKLCAFHAGCHYNTALARGKARSGARANLPHVFLLSHPDGSRNVHPRALFRAARLARRGTFARSPRASGQPAARNCRSRRGKLQSADRAVPRTPSLQTPARSQARSGFTPFRSAKSSPPKPLVEGLQRRFPGRAIFVSTTTETGQRLARERLQSADGIFYFPLDWVVPVRRALRAIRPALVIIMETEIWPNFLREARRAGVPVIFANARISEKSFARFQRWEFLVGAFFNRTMRDAELFLTQSPEDSARFLAMGADEDRIEVTGNLKYDAEPPAIGRFGAWLDQEIRRQERWPVLVAGSVVAGEEEAVLAAYDIVQRQWRHTLLILAPRKPGAIRFRRAKLSPPAAGKSCAAANSIQPHPSMTTRDVLLLDSIGELAGLYSLADATFVGGSLAPAGGHNILEPAWFARPPVFGASMENFREMADQFLDAQLECKSPRARGSEKCGSS